MKNLTAKIVGTGVKSKDYLNQVPKRGDSDYRMSRSDLMEFAKCPHRWVSGYRDEGSDATDWGSMVDDLLLNHGESDFFTLPNEYVNEAGDVKPWNLNSKICRAIHGSAISAGKIPVKLKDWESASKAVVIIENTPEVMDLCYETNTQVMIYGDWVDRATGLSIPLRALVDIVPHIHSNHPNALADLKTCDDASPANWPRKIYQWGYHVQAALYLDLYEAATGEGRTDFLHIVQESKPPYEVGRRYLSQDFIELGRDFYQTALKKYARCLEQKRWPGYDDDSRDGWTITEPEAWMVSHMAAQVTA